MVCVGPQAWSGRADLLQEGHGWVLLGSLELTAGVVSRSGTTQSDWNYVYLLDSCGRTHIDINMYLLKCMYVYMWTEVM